jgi:hypothetical protein
MVTTGKMTSPFVLEAVGLENGMSTTATLKVSVAGALCVAATSIPLRTVPPIVVAKGTVATARVS